MMKRLFLMFLCLAAVSAANAQRKSVIVSVAGTLADAISLNEQKTVTDLKVTGNLNGTDVLLLRQMAGCDAKGIPQKGHLAHLDLADANILAGGDSYYSLASEDQGVHTVNDNLSVNFFSGCLSLKSVVIPNTVTFVSNSAFSFCPNLVSITTSNNKSFSCSDGILYTADGTILVRCPQGKKMAAMTVPEGVKQIYPSAFRGVGSLTKIDLPGSLEAINDAAFRGCPNIVTIKCEAANPPVVEDAFDAAVTGKVTVIVPNASLDMYQSADCWRSFGQIVGGQ